MAKGDVTLKFDAQTAAFVQDLLKARQEMIALANDGRKMGEEAGKAGDRFVKLGQQGGQALGGIASQASGAIAGILGTASAVGLLSGAWSSFLDLQKQKAEGAQKSVQSLEDTLSKMGKIETLGSARTKLDAMRAGLIDRPGSEGMFGNIAQSMMEHGGTEKQIWEATNAAMKGMAAGQSAATATITGQSFGHLAMQSSMAGRSPGDQMELANLITRRAPGGFDKREWNIAESAPTIEEGIDLVLAARASDTNSRKLTPLLDKAQMHISAEEIARIHKIHAKKRTPEENRLLALNAVKEEDRTREIIKNPDLYLSPEEAVQFRHLQQHMGRDAEAAIATRPFAGQISAFGSQITGGDESATAEFLKRQSELKAKDILQKNEADSLRNEAVWETYQNKLKESGGWKSNPAISAAATAAERLVHWAGEDKSSNVGKEADGLTPFESAKTILEASTKQSLNRTFGTAPPTDLGGNFELREGAGMREMIERMDKLVDHTSEQNSLLRTRRGTTLSNDSEGQK